MNTSNIFKNERLKKNFTVYNIFNLILILLIFFLDRFSKIKIINNQSNTNSLFINDYLNYDLVWNTGIGFGLFNLEANIFYHLVSLFIFLVILILLIFALRGNVHEKFLYSMIIGGALGNLYDRITYFAVPDLRCGMTHGTTSQSKYSPSPATTSKYAQGLTDLRIMAQVTSALER